MGGRMTVIGFNFTKISIEKKIMINGKININNNVGITGVDEANLPIVNDKQSALKFDFKFNTLFEPDIGGIEILGELFWLTQKEKAQEMIKSWKKDKNMNRDIMTSVLNTILNKCNIEALILCKDMNLPSPIPLPKFREAPAVSPAEKAERKEEKPEKKDDKSDLKKKK
jgi:hypothetical protein